MRLSAKLSDRRWFWVLITPFMFFGLMPRETGNEFLLKVQRSSLVPYFVSLFSLLAWLAYRQHLSEEVPPVRVNWWLSTFLDLLQGIFANPKVLAKTDGGMAMNALMIPAVVANLMALIADCPH